MKMWQVEFGVAISRGESNGGRWEVFSYYDVEAESKEGAIAFGKKMVGEDSCRVVDGGADGFSHIQQIWVYNVEQMEEEIG